MAKKMSYMPGGIARMFDRTAMKGMKTGMRMTGKKVK